MAFSKKYRHFYHCFCTTLLPFKNKKTQAHLSKNISFFLVPLSSVSCLIFACLWTIAIRKEEWLIWLCIFNHLYFAGIVKVDETFDDLVAHNLIEVNKEQFKLRSFCFWNVAGACPKRPEKFSNHPSWNWLCKQVWHHLVCHSSTC